MSRVLVVNAGSSSVKLAVLDGDEAVEQQSVEPGDTEVLESLLTGGVDAVGHRVVHGGDRFHGPALLDDGVVAAIQQLGVLAPLHQGPALAAVRHTRAALPDVPQVACFDTAFHAAMPAAAATYAVPRRWREEFGVRRYGFHGLAHEWSARRAAQLLGRQTDGLRVVTAHLGSGASLCAVHGGRSVDTTMGMTPTAGLVMSTRSGDLDPAVPPYLAGRGLAPGEVAHALDHDSGLVGLCRQRDLREVLTVADLGEYDALLALDVWTHRVRASVAGMAAAMGGIDVLAFSGGVGEHLPELRARVVAGLGFLGVALDADANAAARGDAVIGAGGAAAATVVVTAREDLVIAAQVRGLLAGRLGGARAG